MKKLLLLSALALGMASAQADDFSNYFKVTFEGNEVKNGQTVYVPGDFLDIDIDPNHEFGIYYAGDFHIANLQDTPRPVYAEIVPVKPTEEEMKANSSFYGGLQLCYQGAFGMADNCLSTPYGVANVPAAGNDQFKWVIDLNAADEKAEVTVRFTMIACTGEATGSYDVIDGAEFTTTLVFTQEQDSVEGIIADSAETEYYTLQGVRVANPDKGIYLVKKGSKVSKRVF